MSRPQHLCIALLAGALIVVRAAAAQEPIAPLAVYDELIAVLMSDAETLAWPRLRTDTERQEFVDRFWEARDPTPGTEVNEVRRVFERRAERAARLFAEADLPGYRTDRGRVMIVLGLPDSQEMRAFSPEGEPELVWSYRRPPLDDAVGFDRHGDGFRLSSEVALDNAVFLASLESELRMQLARAAGGREDAIAEPPEELEEDDEPEAEDSDLTDDDLAPSTEDGTVVEEVIAEPDPVVVSPEIQVWMQLVFGGISRDELQLRHRVDFFPASDATYTVLSFKMGKEAMAFVAAEDSEDSQEEDGQEEDGQEEDSEEGGTDAPEQEEDDADSAMADDRGDEGPADDPDDSETVGDLPIDVVEGDVSEVDAPQTGATEADAAEVDEAATDDSDVDDQDADDGGAVDDEPEEPADPEAHLKLFGAVLQGASGEEDTIHRFLVPYRLGESEGDEQESPTLSLGVSLYPGKYRLAWGVFDETTGNAVTRDEPFDVPDFAGDGLTLTRPLMARPPHATDETAIDPRTIYQGLRLGRMVVRDDLDRTFQRDDIVDVILLASGWSSDPAAPGKPRLEVQYRLLADLEGSRSLAAIPPQVLDFHVLGQQFPLSQVNRLTPGGDYRIEVTVRDLVSGVERVVEAPFHLAPVDEDAVPQ